RLDLVAGVPRACAERAAALDHEALDDAMERTTIIEADFRQGQEVLDVARRYFRQEFQPDRPLRRGQLGHVSVLGQVERLLRFIYLAFHVGWQGTRSFPRSPSPTGTLCPGTLSYSAQSVPGFPPIRRSGSSLSG